MPFLLLLLWYYSCYACNTAVLLTPNGTEIVTVPIVTVKIRMIVLVMLVLNGVLILIY
jgi:hypothetical protein